jgi:hypothetical protein
MEPRLDVEVESVVRGAAAGLWQVTWRLAGDARAVESAWVPHGRFRGVGRVNFTPPRALPVFLEMTVHADEAPGTIVENAFLILRLSDGWRVFVRMRIEFDSSGVPKPVPELVTLQSTGAAE